MPDADIAQDVAEHKRLKRNALWFAVTVTLPPKHLENIAFVAM